MTKYDVVIPVTLTMEQAAKVFETARFLDMTPGQLLVESSLEWLAGI